MNFIYIDLEFMTPLNILEAIGFHSQPVVLCSENFLVHCMSIEVSTKGPFMNLLDKHVCFMSINVPEQDHVVVCLVEYTTIEEEIGRQSSECFLISP